MLRLVKYVYFCLAVYICYEIVRISFYYYDPNFSRGFLIGKKEIWPFYKYALYVHIVSAPIAFVLCIPQLLFPKLKSHQNIGKLYVGIVLLFAAPSGLIMSFWALGGWFGIALFLSLTLLWIVYTYLTYYHIKNGKVQLHRKFAIGSFILCNSAILLRLFHYLNLKLEIFNHQNSYLLISFLSWVPILIIHEIYFLRKRKNAL